MIEERGCVNRLEAGYAWVSCARQAGCERCAAGRGCGGGILGKLLGDRLHRVRAVTSFPVSPGDRVVIGLEESVLLKTSLTVYGLPLISALAGAVTAAGVGALTSATWTDGAAIAGAVLGFLAGLAGVRRFSRRVAHRADYQPVVLRPAER